jgi:DinB superfamily
LSDLRYPIGTNALKATLAPEQRSAAIEHIAELPERLRAAVAGLTSGQMDTPYRPGGWTVRQVVHHLPDSHMHAFLRFKLALTEEQPTIKPYHEARTAELPDYRELPAEVSLVLLDALHRRWTVLLRGMGPDDFARRLMHPERGLVTLDALADDYAWHGRHHVAHITTLRDRMGWR